MYNTYSNQAAWIEDFENKMRIARQNERKTTELALKIKPIVKFEDTVLKHTKIQRIKSGNEVTEIVEENSEKISTDLDFEDIMFENSKAYQNGYFAYIQNSGENIFKRSYAWSPKPLCKAPKMTKLTEISTLHTCSFPLFFKPSEAEVLAQIPEDLIDKVNAYEIYVTDINAANITTDDGQHHIAQVRLFKLADGETEPKEIKDHCQKVREQIIDKL